MMELLITGKKRAIIFTNPARRTSNDCNGVFANAHRRLPTLIALRGSVARRL